MDREPVLRRWVAACAVAETIGMTAASGAARLTQELDDRPGALGGVAVGLGIVVAGGLVEGTALGVAQGRFLSRTWPRLALGRFVGLTVVVAGLGWAAGSAPGLLVGDSGQAVPPLGLMLLGGAGIGVVMGPVLGAAQALALRGAVPHPWRWVAANTAAWPVAMVLIFLGASRPEASWPLVAVLADGAVTGALAGTALGLISGLWLPSLDGPAPTSRLTLWALEHGWFGLGRRLVGLAVTGHRSGRVRRFPTQYVGSGADLLVVPGHAERQAWWRNLAPTGTPLQVLHDGRWSAATGTLLLAGDADQPGALAEVRHAWPAVRLPDDQPVVRITPRPE